MVPTQTVLSNQSQRRHLQDASMNSIRPERPEGRYRRQISLKGRLALRELLGQIRLEPGTDGSSAVLVLGACVLGHIGNSPFRRNKPLPT
jgi:hypothetical protein